MNIMLVSVTERTREIGIRKAVGARRVHIVSQFLIEAVLLSLGGGAIGVLLGAAVAAIVRAATPVPASVQAWSVLLGLLLACSVGLFFGIYPAHRASRLSPITALRQET
jgi:putative ABC transport system permease protein